MPPYLCINKDCKLYNKVDKRSSQSRYDKLKGKVVDSGIKCPECGDDSELVLPSEFSSNLRNFA